jgi:pyruvate formate lyase activating enzyme
MMTNTETITGTILHLQRLSTEDGPGIRTTVFFKAAPALPVVPQPREHLTKKQVQWIGNRCIGCDSCIEACENNALTHTRSGIQRDRAACTVCGSCVDACPSRAMEMLGREVTVAELAAEL